MSPSAEPSCIWQWHCAQSSCSICTCMAAWARRSVIWSLQIAKSLPEPPVSLSQLARHARPSLEGKVIYRCLAVQDEGSAQDVLLGLAAC